MASYSFPKTSLTFNFEGGTSAIPIIVEDPSSYDQLVTLLQNVKVRMLKKVPIMEVFRGVSPNGTSVGTYLLDQNDIRSELINTAGTNYYVEDTGEKEDVYENLNEILFPSTQFEEEPFFTVTTPGTREDDSPNLMFTASENTVKGVSKNVSEVYLSTTDSYLIEPSYKISINQTPYIAEGYFLLIREGVEYEEGDPNPKFKGSAISSLYLKQGKRVVNQIINSSSLPKIKLDREGYELRINGFNGTKLASATLPSQAINYDKFLATITYEGCSANTSCFDVLCVSYEDASSLEALMAQKQGIVVIRNKTNDIFALESDIGNDSSFYPNESFYGTNTSNCSFDLSLSLNGETIYSSATTLNADRLKILDIYNGCSGNSGYPYFLCSHGNSQLYTSYSNDAKIPVANVTSLPSTIKLGSSSGCSSSIMLTATGSHDYCSFKDLYRTCGFCINECILTDICYDIDGSAFNTIVESTYYVENTNESVDNRVAYFGGTFYHDKPEFECLPTDQFGTCSESYPVSLAYVSEEFNEESGCGSTCSCSCSGSGCSDSSGCSGCSGCVSSVFYGDLSVISAYYGDIPIQSIYYGDNKIF